MAPLTPQTGTPPTAEARRDSTQGQSQDTAVCEMDTHYNVPDASSPYSEGVGAWLQVVGGFCLNLNTWGLLNAYGAFQTYYSLDLLRDHPSSDIAWIGSVQAFLMFAVSFLIGPIFDSGHLQWLLWCGSFLSVFGFFMLSLCTTYWQCFLAQGIVMGLGFGCLYLPAPALISMHFQKNLGLAMGLASCGSGVGGIIFPLAFSRLQGSLGFAWTTRVLAFILLGTSIFPLLTMKYPSNSFPDISEEKRDSSLRRTLAARIRGMMLSVIDVSAFSDTPYLLLNLGLATGYMGLYCILYYISLLALDRTDSSQSLSFYILVIINAATIVGRIAPSAAADHIGSVHVLGLTALISCVMVFCVLVVKSPASIIVWAALFGIPAGAFQGLPAAGVVSISDKGNAQIGVRLGMTLLTVGIGVLVAEPVAGAILGGPGSWTGLTGWSGGLLAASFILMLLARTLKVGSNLRTPV